MIADQTKIATDNTYRYIYPSILCMLWVAFFAFFIGNRGLWSPDEPRYLQVAWEMAKARHFLIPILNGEIYSEKPPLYFWLAILMAKIVGFEASTRWVSALAGFGGILLTHSIGSLLMDRKTGFVSAIILMTSGYYTFLLTTGNIDMLLTFFITFSIYAYIRYQQQNGTAWLTAAYLSCGFGILAKGPVGFLLPWLLFVAWTVYQSVNGEKPEWKHLLWGIPVTLIPVCAWLIPAIITGGEEYARTILIKQNVGRTVGSFAHAKPWYSYFIDLPTIVLPWTLAFIGVIPETIRSVREKNRAVIFIVLWLAVVFIFFSLVSGKRSQYLMPLMPAFALIVGYGLIKLENWSMRTLFLDTIGVLISFVLLAVLIFPVLQPMFAVRHEELRVFGLEIAGWRAWALYAEGVLAVIALGVGFTMALQKRMTSEIYAFSIAFLLLFATLQIYYFPAFDRIKSARLASSEIRAMLPPGGTVAFYGGRYTEGWNFYLDRPVIPVATAGDLQSKKYNVVIAEKKHGKTPLELYTYVIVDNVRIGGDIFHLCVPGGNNIIEKAGHPAGQLQEPAKVEQP